MSTPHYPFRIRATPGVVLFTVGMWGLLFAGVVVWAHFIGASLGLVLGLSLLAVVSLVFVTLLTIRDEKVLFEDAIEFRTLFGVTRFDIVDLEGYRRRRIPNLPGVVAFHLVPKVRNRAGRAIVIIPGVLPVVDAWLAKLCDVGSG